MCLTTQVHVVTAYSARRYLSGLAGWLTELSWRTLHLETMGDIGGGSACWDWMFLGKWLGRSPEVIDGRFNFKARDWLLTCTGTDGNSQ